MELDRIKAYYPIDMAYRELLMVDPDAQRVDLIDCLLFALAEGGIATGYQLAVKAYSNLPHGQQQDAKEALVGIENLRENIRVFRRNVARQVEWAAWSTAISSVLVENNEIPRWFVPAIDLEIDATDDPETDLRRVDYQLVSVGYTGAFLQSGDRGSGSYFFVADRVVPFEGGFKEFIGLVMVTLLDFRDTSDESKTNWKKSMELGEEVLSASRDDQLQNITNIIFQTFPSIPGGRFSCYSLNAPAC